MLRDLGSTVTISRLSSHHTISVDIPVYNSAGTLRLCVEQLFRSTAPSFECIVVDDG